MSNTNTAVSPVEFNFNANAIRTAAINEEVWFCATDVCGVLGYLNPSDIIKKHCKTKGVSKRYTLTDGGNQELTYINEPNLYRLVIRSKKPEAEKFEEWVMEEVLPSIRRTGSYSATISKAQQGEIATRISEKFLDGRKRPYAWSRFNNHFRIASYKDLPASRFEEACEYITTMPMSKEEEEGPRLIPAPLENMAFRRFIACFDRNQKLSMTEVGNDAFIITEDEIAQVLREPGSLIKTKTIIDIMNACTEVMSHRSGVFR